MTPDARGLVHASDAESGRGRGWRAASPQPGAGSRAGDCFLSPGTGRASSSGQRPTCPPPSPSPPSWTQGEWLSHLVKKLERVALARKLFCSQEGPLPPQTPSRTETETRVGSGLNTQRWLLNSLAPHFHKGFPVPCKHCTPPLSPHTSPHCGHGVKGRGGGAQKNPASRHSLHGAVVT